MDVITVLMYLIARYRAITTGSVMEEAVVRVEFETRMRDVLMVVVGGGVVGCGARGCCAQGAGCEEGGEVCGGGGGGVCDCGEGGGFDVLGRC